MSLDPALLNYLSTLNVRVAARRMTCASCGHVKCDVRETTYRFIWPDNQASSPVVDRLCAECRLDKPIHVEIVR